MRRKRVIQSMSEGSYTGEMYEMAARTLEARLWFMPPGNPGWAPGGSEQAKAAVMPPKERWKFTHAAAVARGDRNANRVLPQAQRRLTDFPAMSEIGQRANAA